MQASTSWRFSEDVGVMPHLALFVRDAAGLGVPAAPDVPPPLSGEVPDLTAGTEDERVAAAGQWTSWWRAILTAEAQIHRPSPEPEEGGRTPQREVERRTAEAARLAEPPDFAALDGASELQAVLRRTFAEGHRWVNRHRRDLLMYDRPAQIPWVLLREVAERTAGDLGVPVGDLHGQALVLMVAGSWWTLAAPGVALASVQAAREAATATDLVGAAFTSALSGESGTR